jgi:hypothetical protein
MVSSEEYGSRGRHGAKPGGKPETAGDDQRDDHG